MTVSPQNSDESTSPEEDTYEDLTGELLSDRYMLEKRIGEGAMGAVYRAQHTLMKKRVAIKMLHGELSQRAEISERFQREAMAAAHIEHPNVCGATDFGRTKNGEFFMVMEFLEGEPLKSLIDRKKRLAPERALRIADQIAGALDAAHQMGIVHRDLKPDNVFLVERDGTRDFVKIVDFGIAHMRMGDDDGTQLTQAGMVYGTPQYLSPEQAVGEEIDLRADLYALGIVLFEMLAGRPPFVGDNIVQLIGKHVTMPPPTMNEVAPGAHIPQAAEDLVAHLLAKTPAQRPASAGQVRVAIAEIMGELSGDLNATLPSQGVRLADVPSNLEETAFAGTSDPSTKGATLRTSAGQKLFDLATDSAKKRPWIYPAIGVGAIALVILVIALIGSGGDESDEDKSGLGGSALAEGSGSEPSEGLDRSATDDLLGMLTEAAAGEPEEALAQLAELQDKYGDKPDYLAVLAATQLRARKGDAAGKTIDALVEADSKALDNNDVIMDAIVAEVSRQERDVTKGFLKAVSEHMGLPLAQRFATIAMVGEHRSARKRTYKLLDTAGFLPKLDDWQRASVELRAAERGGCSKRKKLLAEIVEIGDPRALPVVMVFDESPPKGCGFLSQEDCQGCMRTELTEAISALSTP